MLEIEYSMTTSLDFLNTIVESYTNASGERVYVQENSLVFPPGIAEGKFSFYEIEPGLSICCLDCTFIKGVRFKRSDTKANDIKVLHVNLSTMPFWLNQQGKNSIDVGTGWKNAVFYGQSHFASEFVAEAGTVAKVINIYFTKDWWVTSNEVAARQYPSLISTLLDENVQRTIDLDLGMLLAAQEIIGAAPPIHALNLYYEGCARKIIALFINRLTTSLTSEEELDFSEVSRVIAAKDKILNELDQPVPTLEQVAEQCNVSKSKFSYLFRAVFNKAYSDFFLEAKMQKAADLLLEGYSIAEVGNALNYKNLGHFAGSFYSYYHTTPKFYKRSIFNKGK
ncbi:helix-turn-helix domain-containing protein [Taibaiella soli]|uniref:HTH araC/xylS-type domain-containing protein n=1 Tax=Taibaiella soli TaxID=1649169 RepID=A0A2W2AVS2_9BACT|nr:AraC family transcriptional regulator [Taibaiella soli]PZF71768.1 hypothetical protein DN068_17030 [Taibaiella soli]